jgi:hypothetical protein
VFRNDNGCDVDALAWFSYSDVIERATAGPSSGATSVCRVALAVTDWPALVLDFRPDALVTSSNTGTPATGRRERRLSTALALL